MISIVDDCSYSLMIVDVWYGVCWFIDWCFSRLEIVSSVIMVVILSVFEDLKDGRIVMDEKVIFCVGEIWWVFFKVMGSVGV